MNPKDNSWYPYQIIDIDNKSITLLMLIDIDSDFCPVFTERVFEKDPFFEYEGIILCDYKIGFRGFMVSAHGDGFGQLSRVDQENLGIYSEIFDDYNKYGSEMNKKYQYHFREFRLKQILDDDDATV